MPLLATVAKIEDVSEDLREEYIEGEDGKFHLKILGSYVPKDSVEDVSGLKSALKKERENASTAAARARKLEEDMAGIDPEDYARLKEMEAKEEENKAKKAGEWDKLREQMNTKHAEELAKRDKDKSRLMTALEKRTIDAAAVSALNELKGNVTLLLPHVKGHVKMIEDETGDFVARVVDDAGNPRVNGEGKFLSVRELVGEMRDSEVFAKAFEASGHSGGGTPPNGQGGTGGTGKKGGIPSGLKRTVMTTKDKVAFIKEHGEDEFMKLPL